MMKRLLAVGLVVIIASAAPANAQAIADADAWHTFAGQLEPNAFVRVTLKSGESFKGHIVRVTDDGVRVNPKKRIAVPLRQIPYNDIISMQRTKEAKWNPASKVLVGVGAGLAMFYTIAIIAAASFYGSI